MIGSGPFKGKKIELASTSRVEAVSAICEEFMERIFEFALGDYLITDESRLRDFADVFEPDIEAICDRIRAEYGMDVSHIKSGNLLEIFEEIRRRRSAGLQ